MAATSRLQLIRQLAQKTRIKNRTAAALLEHLVNTAIKEVKKNGTFVVPGLGRFVIRQRKARSGSGYVPDKSIQIKTVVKFKPAKC